MRKKQFKAWIDREMPEATQKEISEFLLVSYSTVCKWCSGERQISQSMWKYINLMNRSENNIQENVEP